MMLFNYKSKYLTNYYNTPLFDKYYSVCIMRSNPPPPPHIKYIIICISICTYYAIFKKKSILDKFFNKK